MYNHFKICSVLLLLTTSILADSSTCSTYCAQTAVVTSGVGGSGSVPETAYYFYNNSYPPSVYVTSTNSSSPCSLQFSFTGSPANALSITGPVYAIDGHNAGFFINLQLTVNNTYYNPMLELQSNQYKANGGTVDPHTFTFWQLSFGSLTGFGDYANDVIVLTQSDHLLMIGTGANGKNLNYGAGGWFFYNSEGHSYHTDLNVDLNCSSVTPTSAPTAAPTSAPTAASTSAPTSAPTEGPTAAPTTAPTATPTEEPTAAPTSAPTSAPTEGPTAAPTSAPTTEPYTTSGSGSSGSGSTTGDSTSGTTGSSNSSFLCPPNPYVVGDAQADQYGGNAGFAFIFNDTTTNTQYKYSFSNDSGRFQINEDGSALLTGYLTPQSTSSDGLFNFDIMFEIAFTAGTAPATYLKELNPAAYVPNGTVDPTTWSFYTFNYAHFKLSDTSNSLGVVPYTSMGFQTGEGANGKNTELGGSLWLVYYLADASDVALSIGVVDLDFDFFCEQGTSTGLTGLSSSGTSSGSSGTGEALITPSPAPSTPSAATYTTFCWALLIALVAFVNF